MTFSVTRFITVRLIGWGAGIALGAIAAALYLSTQVGTPPVEAQPIARPAGWQQDMTTAETAKWITADCKTPAAWDKTQIPASAVVRNDTDLVISHLSFDKAYDLAEDGVVWMLALCARQ